VRIPGGRSWISRYPSGTSQSEPRHAGLPRHGAARLIFKKERRRITEPGAITLNGFASRGLCPPTSMAAMR